MKVTFEELKGAFYRVLRSRNIAEDTATSARKCSLAPPSPVSIPTA